MGLVVIFLVLAMVVSDGATRSYNDDYCKALSPLHWESQDWILAFRLTAGIDQPVYDNYMNQCIDDDHPLARLTMPKTCLSSVGPCDRHYHSSILNHWPSSLVDQVRVQLFKGERNVAEIVFNGKNSDKLSWFSANNVLSSTWTSLGNETFNFFSIPGHRVEGVCSRRFFINRNYGGCLNDAGWLCVQDTLNETCDWGKLKDHYPAILYSAGRTYTNFNTMNAVDRADVMTISVKLNI